MNTPSKLIVLMAFDRDDEGELQPAFEPREMPDEARAKATARDMSTRHTGVIAWARSADPDIGEYGPRMVLAVYGDVPEME